MELTYLDPAGHVFTVGVDVADDVPAAPPVSRRALLAHLAVAVGARITEAVYQHARGPFEVVDHG
jgi:hypothetical protein